MNRMGWLCLGLALLVALAACTSRAASATRAAASNSPLGQNYENALSVPNQLVVGTFRLEKTDQAVTAQQASALLPVWKAYRNLSSSQSASSVELRALLEQLQQTMTREQLTAIAAMRLTSTDMQAVMQAQGLEIQTGSSASSSSAGQKTAQSTQRTTDNGGPPAGGPPGGGPGEFGSLGGQAPSAMQTAAAGTQSSSTAGLTVQGSLLNALIKLLAAKV